MKSYAEQNQEMHEEESSKSGHIGMTNVQLAKEIFLQIEAFINPDEGENYMIWRIARALQKYRTY